MLRKLKKLIALAEKKGFIFTALQRRERGWSLDFYNPSEDRACNYVSGVVMLPYRPSPMDAIETAIAWMENKPDNALAIDAYRP